MIKEPKNIDFYTTGKQPSEQDFVRISEWIKKDKQRKSARKVNKQLVHTKVTSQTKPQE